MTLKLRYDDEHALLRDEARRWLAERVTPAELRRLAKDARGDDPSLWKALAELGWTGLAVPERFGGAGLGALHTAVLLEECGRRLLPSPLLPTLLTARLLDLAGDETQRERWLPRIARGELVAALAHVEADGAWQASETRASCAGGRVSGAKHCVWAAPSADLFVVPVLKNGALRFALVEASAGGVAVEPEVGLDPSRRQGRVRFENAPAELLAGEGEAAWRAFLAFAWLALAAEMAGGADAALALTAEYAKTREQFGKPIGSFQAIKHPLVNVLIAVEELRTLVYAAAAAIEAGDAEAETLARMAKAAASETYPWACSRAVQFHGGYGFTDDCDAHLYLRRAQCTRPAFGDARQQRAAIAATLLDVPAA